MKSDDNFQVSNFPDQFSTFRASQDKNYYNNNVKRIKLHIGMMMIIIIPKPVN
jgi:hypothetical protein